jgi:hypothetical protein
VFAEEALAIRRAVSGDAAFETRTSVALRDEIQEALNRQSLQ